MNSHKGMIAWMVCTSSKDRPLIRMRRGTPLSEVLEAITKALPKRLQKNIVGKPVRVMCPRCGKKGKYSTVWTVWQWRGPKGEIVFESHLYKGVDYDNCGRVWKWEVV